MTSTAGFVRSAVPIKNGRTMARSAAARKPQSEYEQIFYDVKLRICFIIAALTHFFLESRSGRFLCGYFLCYHAAFFYINMMFFRQNVNFYIRHCQAVAAFDIRHIVIAHSARVKNCYRAPSPFTSSCRFLMTIAVFSSIPMPSSCG